MMSRFVKIIGACALAIAIGLSFAACTPPNYSKDKAKEIADVHRPEAETWFAEHYPQAEIKSCRAYKDSTDLYSALTGTYKVGRAEYSYVYDYYNRAMYLSEGYDEVCGLVAAEIGSAFGLDDERTEYHFYGLSFTTASENDDAKDSGRAQGEMISSLYEKLVPAGDTADSARSVLDGSTEFRFYVTNYMEAFPKPDVNAFNAYPNLHSITYNVPVDGDFCGEYRQEWSKNGCSSKYARVTKLEDGLYGGYLCGSAQELEDKLSFDRQDENSFSLEIPEGTELIIFSDKKLKLVNCFSNTAGEAFEEESDELYKAECPGWPGMYKMSHDLLVTSELSHGYGRDAVAEDPGLYIFKVK